MADISEFKSETLFSLKGWVAVVTGGGTGLGLTAARALAANGARVYITGRRLEKLQAAELHKTKNGGSIQAMQMDVTSKDSIIATAEKLKKQEKCINLLVNNAGVHSIERSKEGMPSGTPEEFSNALLKNSDFEKWAPTMATNVTGVYFTSVAFLPLLCAARRHGFPESGSIINVTSVSAITKTSQSGQFSYNSSKAAAQALTMQLAAEFKRPDLEVRVNAIAPGLFRSEMVNIPDDVMNNGKEFWRDEKVIGIPLGRPGEPRDYAQAILSLALNRYCSGSTFLVDGGWLLAHP